MSCNDLAASIKIFIRNLADPVPFIGSSFRLIHSLARGQTSFSFDKQGRLPLPWTQTNGAKVKVVINEEDFYLGKVTSRQMKDFPGGIITTTNSIGYYLHTHRKPIRGTFNDTRENVVELLIDASGARPFIRNVVWLVDTIKFGPESGDTASIKDIPVKLHFVGDSNAYLDMAIDQVLQGLAQWFIQPGTGNLIIYNVDKMPVLSDGINIQDLEANKCVGTLQPRNINVDLEYFNISRVEAAKDAESFETGGDASLDLPKRNVSKLGIADESTIFPLIDKTDKVVSFVLIPNIAGPQPPPFGGCTYNVIFTIAGNGSSDPSLPNGDGGQALDAKVHLPFRVTTNSQGDVFFTEARNTFLIRKFGVDGIISTIMGISGVSATMKPTFNVAALGQALGVPLPITSDINDNIYYVDTKLLYIGKIDINGIVTEFVDLAAFYAGFSIVINPNETSTQNIFFFNDILYTVDRTTHTVLKTENGITNVFAGIPGVSGFTGDGGLATSATLIAPSSVAVDTLGNVYIADGGTLRIRRVDVNTNIIDTWAGHGSSLPPNTGEKLTVRFSDTKPTEIVFDKKDNLYIFEPVSNPNNFIRKIDNDGQVTLFAGTGIQGFSGDFGPLLSAQFANASNSSGIWIDRNNQNIYIADQTNFRIRIIPCQHICNYLSIYTIGGTGEPGYTGNGGPALQSKLQAPSGLTVLPNGDLIIAENANFTLRRIDIAGNINSVIGTGIFGIPTFGIAALGQPIGEVDKVTSDELGNIYFIDSSNENICKIDISGMLVLVSNYHNIGSAFGIAVSSDGNTIYTGHLASGAHGGTIHRFEGGIATIYAGQDGNFGYSGDGGLATDALLNRPFDLILDPANNLFFSDINTYTVRRIDFITKVITTVAGNGIQGFSGDGGLAVDATFDQISGIALDAVGNLFIADCFNNFRLREVDNITQKVGTIAFDGTAGFAGNFSDPLTAKADGFNFGFGVTVNRRNGDIYILDEGNHRVRIMPCYPGAIIATIPGTWINPTGSVQESGGVLVLGSNDSTTNGTGMALISMSVPLGTTSFVVKFDYRFDFLTTQPSSQGAASFDDGFNHISQSVDNVSFPGNSSFLGNYVSPQIPVNQINNYIESLHSDSISSGNGVSATIRLFPPNFILFS